ncbi:MAG TPA: hypothetical protein VGP25_10190 [Gemmatimonadaceae bacterium]|jgi:hypothetical protein|nr:hypothetical protein [Gemmatimonadaceae bacterium]
MAKSSMGGANFSDYALVADRITLFYLRFPTGRIVTQLHSRSDTEITFRALVFRGADDRRPAATGWASERLGDGEINQVACLENTETSAIGRALANLGFTASTRRPSREEMEKAARERARIAVLGAVAAQPRSSLDSPVRAPVDAGSVQRRANAVHDAVGLIERAEAIGFPHRRAEIIRQALERPALTPRTLTRLERRVRAWIARHRPHGR